MSIKWVRIANNFSEKAKITAVGMACTFTLAWSGEKLHCQRERPQGLAFVNSCWSMDLPPHTPAMTPNTMTVNVLLPSHW